MKMQGRSKQSSEIQTDRDIDIDKID